MATGAHDAPEASGQEPGATYEHSHDGALPAAGWSALHAGPVAPLWMRAQLVRLQAAFPEFSFNICPGWRGLTFEAWRDDGAAGLYAVITRDVSELWRELEGGREGSRPVADTCGKEAR
jgi:hypothetical protein